MTQTNDRIALEREHLKPMSDEQLNHFSEAILYSLGEPMNPLHNEAVRCFSNQDYDLVKRLCLSNPCDSYLAALSCLSSAHRSPTIADSVLRDAARHTADLARERVAYELSVSFSEILREER